MTLTSKNIRIGNQTAFMALTPLDPFLYAVENHFDAFEWFPDKKESGAGWALDDITKKMRRSIKKTALANDIALSVHAPWWANPLKPEGKKIFRENISFAKDIGATLLNIHLETEDGLEDYVQAILPIIKYCRKAGLKLSIENTPLTTPEEFNQLFALLRDVSDTASDHVGMCFDLGHANLCSSTLNDYIGFLDRLESRVPLIHLHLHENYGDQDAHLVIFTGPAGQNDQGLRFFFERLAGRSFKGAIILEQWPDPPSMLNTARLKIIQMLADSTGQQVAPIPSKEKSSKKLPIPEGDEGRFASRLIESDQQHQSWRQKLDGVYKLLHDTSELTDDDLIYLAIYLRFLGTGEIVCTEDGRHFRPSHHARISQQIQERLLVHTSTDNAFILRKIYPWLPSYDRAFTRAEPLTRIRDIAHRNDIPSELKKEIKHTLQNKLHRCAGPEDLTTSENILGRITAPGADYSWPFVEQFKIFHQELQEFFNAASLEKNLHKISQEDEKIAQSVQRFLEIKESFATAGKQSALLQQITELRSKLSQQIKHDASAHTQNMRLADLGLEDYAFVLLSEVITEFENCEELPWQKALEALIVNVENIRLSGMAPEECMALISELKAWRVKFDPKVRSHLLRLKATLARSQRLADSYSEKELGLFFEKAILLGRSLGLASQAIELYCEGDIRGNLIFQLSKLNDLLLKNIRTIAKLPPWDVIAPGIARGRVHAAEFLTDLATSKAGQKIVLVNKAEGDETIAKGVGGIILAHHLPHLSHLAIRTRQEGVVLVVAEDLSLFRELSQQVGKNLTLTATADSVTFAKKTSAKTLKKLPIAKKVCMPDLLIADCPQVVKLDKVTLSNAGAKADGARRLQELAKKKDADFSTPKGVVIPFGVMEAALDAGALKKQYTSFKQRLDNLIDIDDYQAAEDLLKLFKDLAISNKITSAIKKIFATRDRLMVRSSSSCEDLATISGAGLYDSVANVAPAHVDEAVRKVWASMWTRRATISRRQNGIAEDQTYMAVLIQQMLNPDYSFVMHTVNPINHKNNEIYIELAVGQGETLASGSVPGTPYRIVCQKKTGKPTMMAFADFSKALWADSKEGMIAKLVNYSACSLSINEKVRTRMAKRLAAIGRLVENTFGSPQDIEGAIVGDTIWLVQSRPQILVG